MSKSIHRWRNERTLAEAKRSRVLVPIAITTTQVRELSRKQTSECWSYKSTFNRILSQCRWKQVNVVHRPTSTVIYFC